MKRFLLFTAVTILILTTAGCPEMTEDKPGASAQSQSAPPPPPPPPPSAPGNEAAADDDSVPVEEVDPKQFALEQAAADELEKMDVLVIREGQEKTVTSIHFKGNGKKIDKKITDQIPNLFRISTINFADTDMGNEQLKSVQYNRRLVSLVLGGTQVSDEGMAYLSGLENLVSLLMPNTKITDASLPLLAKLPKLAILDISGSKITDRGLSEIAKCSSLNWLLISGTDVTDEGVQSLANMPNLGRLTLLDTKVTEQGIAALKAAKPKLAVDSGSRKPNNPQ